MIPTIDASAKCLCTHYNASHRDGKCLLCDGCTGFKTFTQVIDHVADSLKESLKGYVGQPTETEIAAEHRQPLRQKFPAATAILPKPSSSLLKDFNWWAANQASRSPYKMVRTTVPPGLKVGDLVQCVPGFTRPGYVTNIMQTADGLGEAEVVEVPAHQLESLESRGYEASLGMIGDKLTHVSLSKRDPNQPPLHGQKDEFVKPPVLGTLKEIYLRTILENSSKEFFSSIGIDWGEVDRGVIQSLNPCPDVSSFNVNTDRKTGVSKVTIEVAHDSPAYIRLCDAVNLPKGAR